MSQKIIDPKLWHLHTLEVKLQSNHDETDGDDLPSGSKAKLGIVSAGGATSQQVGPGTKINSPRFWLYICTTKDCSRKSEGNRMVWLSSSGGPDLRGLVPSDICFLQTKTQHVETRSRQDADTVT